MYPTRVPISTRVANLSLLALFWRGHAERKQHETLLQSPGWVKWHGCMEGLREGFHPAGVKLMGEINKKIQKKELHYKSRKAWRQNLVTRVRTDWFHVGLLNSVSVWRRHWPSVDGCTSQETCWVTSNACDCRRTPVWGPSMADPSWWWS